MLQLAIEAQKMAMFGVEIQYSAAVPILIGVLREKHGCLGPDKKGVCPWHAIGVGMAPQSQGMYATTRVRLITPPRDTEETPGTYL